MKTAILITGASTGIGKEFALIAAANKHNVLLIARNEDKLKALCKEIVEKYKVEANYIPTDLSTAGSAAELYQTTKDRGYQITYLINNAGFGDYGNFAERKLEKFEQMIQLNITSLTELTHLFVNDMIKAKQGGVLNIASTAAMQPDPYMAVYGATKSYVANFTEALSYELRGTGVTATVLSPGPTTTEFFDAAQMSESKMAASAMMPANKVAQLGYNAMMKGKLHVIAGWKNKIMELGSTMIPFSKLKLAVAASILKKG